MLRCEEGVPENGGDSNFEEKKKLDIEKKGIRRGKIGERIIIYDKGGMKAV